ncbi:MAG: TonB family protein [Acidobacteria bacterium]|nr:TonB family protein [Acidobacteriota bacterium]
MGAIFVSYRRSDSQGEAGRVFDDLVAEFGEDMVFMDVAAIEAGRDFRKVIEESVSQCSVLLVVIGPEWLNAKNESGTKRLDDPTDFVRIETASALRRDIPVIPLLVRGAQMPHPDQLPEALKDLAYRNCCELTHARWRSDLQLLIDALHRVIGNPACRETKATPGKPPSNSPLPLPQTSETFPVSKPFTGIDAAILERLTKDLAVHIGPISEVVVRRLASHCASAEDLCREAAEEIESRAEREEFLLKHGRLLASSSPDKEISRNPSGTVPPERVSPTSKEKQAKSEVARAAPKHLAMARKSLFVAGGTMLAVLLLLAAANHFGRRENRFRYRVGSEGQGAPERGPIARKTYTLSSPAGNQPNSGSSRGAPQASVQTETPSTSAQMKPAVFKPAGGQKFRVPAEVSSSLVVRKVVPDYPRVAQDARVQGAVVLEANISRDGIVREIRGISGSPLLMPAAIDAVKQWQYNPLVLNGKPVEMQTLITINFTLKIP